MISTATRISRIWVGVAQLLTRQQPEHPHASKAFTNQGNIPRLDLDGIAATHVINIGLADPASIVTMIHLDWTAATM